MCLLPYVGPQLECTLASYRHTRFATTIAYELGWVNACNTATERLVIPLGMCSAPHDHKHEHQWLQLTISNRPLTGTRTLEGSRDSCCCTSLAMVSDDD